jgi:hypothetical protein
VRRNQSSCCPHKTTGVRTDQRRLTCAPSRSQIGISLLVAACRCNLWPAPASRRPANRGLQVCEACISRHGHGHRSCCMASWPGRAAIGRIANTETGISSLHTVTLCTQAIVDSASTRLVSAASKLRQRVQQTSRRDNTLQPPVRQASGSTNTVEITAAQRLQSTQKRRAQASASLTLRTCQVCLPRQNARTLGKLYTVPTDCVPDLYACASISSSMGKEPTLCIHETCRTVQPLSIELISPANTADRITAHPK